MQAGGDGHQSPPDTNEARDLWALYGNDLHPEKRMTDDGPIAYAPTAILTVEDLARWLQLHPDTVKSWPIPRLRLPGKTVRYSAGAVLKYLEGGTA